MDPIKSPYDLCVFWAFYITFCLFFCFSAAPKHIKVTNGSGKTGTTTELSCTYDGRPLPTIKWLGFGKDLNQVSDINLLNDINLSGLQFAYYENDEFFADFSTKTENLAKISTKEKRFS